MLRDYFEVLKTIAMYLFVLALVCATLWGCWGSYFIDPSTRINKIEKDISVKLYSDTTAMCGAHTDDYYTVVVIDSADSVSWSLGLSRCYRCGSLFGGHHSRYYWTMAEAQANYQD